MTAVEEVVEEVEVDVVDVEVVLVDVVVVVLLVEVVELEVELVEVVEEVVVATMKHPTALPASSVPRAACPAGQRLPADARA